MATNTKTHTPGPWRSNGALIEGPKMALQIALVYREKLGNAPVDDAEFRANVALIEAAPDMLAALVEAVQFHGPFGDDTRPKWWAAACTAIAKAKG